MNCVTGKRSPRPRKDAILPSSQKLLVPQGPLPFPPLQMDFINKIKNQNQKAKQTPHSLFHWPEQLQDRFSRRFSQPVCRRGQRQGGRRGSKCWKGKGACTVWGQPGRSPSPEKTRSLLPCFMTTPSPLSSVLCPRNPACTPITPFPGETLIQLQGNAVSPIHHCKRRPAASAENTTPPRFGSNGPTPLLEEGQSYPACSQGVGE